MRKTLMLAVSSILLALLAPASALAHHLEQDTSTLSCVLVNNVPTVKVSANFVDFSPWDQPVFWSVSIDRTRVGGGALTWSGPNFRHNVAFATTPGTHDVVYQATWNQGDNGGYLSRHGLVCPQAVPPPPPPTTLPPPPAAPPAPSGRGRRSA